MGEIKLSLLQKIKLKIFGYVYVGHRNHPGWKEPLPFYAFNCPKHGLVADYPHGCKKRLVCPQCQEEDLTEKVVRVVLGIDP